MYERDIYETVTLKVLWEVSDRDVFWICWSEKGMWWILCYFKFYLTNKKNNDTWLTVSLSVTDVYNSDETFGFEVYPELMLILNMKLCPWNNNNNNKVVDTLSARWQIFCCKISDMQSIQMDVIYHNFEPNKYFPTTTIGFSHLGRASCCYQSFLLPTDAQENRFQRSIKIYIKITIAPTTFRVIIIIRERTGWAFYS